MAEDNFNLLQNSIEYSDYQSKCEANTPNYIASVSSSRYEYIKSKGFLAYDDYLVDLDNIICSKLDAFLVKAIPNFDNCSKMDSVNYNDREFTDTLSDTEISILADITVFIWYERENFDTKQFTGMIQNKSEAHRYSEANLLRERTNKENSLREAIDTKKAKYDLKNNFKEWKY